AVDQDGIPAQQRRVRVGGGDEIVDRRLEGCELQIVRLADRRRRPPGEQRIELAFAHQTFATKALELQLQDGELCLRLDHVLLRGLADAVARLADLHQRLEQI